MLIRNWKIWQSDCQEVADKDDPVHLREWDGSKTGLSSVSHGANRFPHNHSCPHSTQNSLTGKQNLDDIDNDSDHQEPSPRLVGIQAPPQWLQVKPTWSTNSTMSASGLSPLHSSQRIIIIITPILYLSYLSWNHSSKNQLVNHRNSPPTQF